MNSIARAGFLGRKIGFKNLFLEGEEGRTEAIKIVNPVSFLKVGRPVAVSLNADSLTEMSRKTARTYMELHIGDNKSNS